MTYLIKIIQTEVTFAKRKLHLLFTPDTIQMVSGRKNVIYTVEEGRKNVIH
jgi:hypothetical protein